MIASAGHNLPSAREWLYAVLHSGEVTRVGQHLALVIFHIVDENGHASASVRDLERITGWGRQTIADHLGELRVFMAVTLGAGRGKSEFDLQCKITRAVNELRCVRQLDANGMRFAQSSVQQADASVQEMDKTTVRDVDANPDTNSSVRQMDAKAVASGKMASQPDTKQRLSRARIESSLREDNSTLEDKNTPLNPPNADELARQAYLEGERIKQGTVAKSARATQRARGELDGSRGITLTEDGEVIVVNGARAKLLEAFPKLDIDEVCDRAAPDIAKLNYPSFTTAMSMLRKWARILASNPPPATPKQRDSEDDRFNRLMKNI